MFVSPKPLHNKYLTLGREEGIKRGDKRKEKDL